ncbi:hypothetical protein ACFVJM_31760 [Streptomyces virginiae]|uniref:hypothetical protein n=1 Tax=Streptomyces virginiae TaxID=1961 RepID=UPI00362F33A4
MAYAIGTAAGGISGPLIFAAFSIGAGLMLAAGLAAVFHGRGRGPLPGGHRHPLSARAAEADPAR